MYVRAVVVVVAAAPAAPAAEVVVLISMLLGVVVGDEEMQSPALSVDLIVPAAFPFECSKAVPQQVVLSVDECVSTKKGGTLDLRL